MVASNAVAISAGTGHSLALRRDGTVNGWGGNIVGNATGIPTDAAPYLADALVRIDGQLLSNVVSIAASRTFSLALKRDGTVATWGENYVPAGLTNVVAIGVDQAHSWILKSNGSVVGWFKELSAHYGLLTAEGVSNAVAIAVGSAPQGGTRGLAILRDGTVANWGRKFEHPDANPPAGLSNVVAVAAGAGHSLALKKDGTVVGWGWNQWGEATGAPADDATQNLTSFSSGPVRLDGRTLSNIVSIAAGRGYSIALKEDGTVATWGRMAWGLYPVTVPEGLSNVVAIAAGAEDFCLAITTNKAVADRFANGRN